MKFPILTIFKCTVRGRSVPSPRCVRLAVHFQDDQTTSNHNPRPSTPQALATPMPPSVLVSLLQAPHVSGITESVLCAGFFTGHTVSSPLPPVLPCI